MDMLKEARRAYDQAGRNGFDAQVSQAAAMIAIAEALAYVIRRDADARPKFMQIAGRRFNADAVTQVETFDPSPCGEGRGITIYFASGPAFSLRGEEMAQFLLWHEKHADVVRLGEA